MYKLKIKGKHKIKPLDCTRVIMTNRDENKSIMVKQSGDEECLRI